MSGFMQPSEFDLLGSYGQGANLYNTSPVSYPGVVTNSAFTPMPGMPAAQNSGLGWNNMLGPDGWGGQALGVAQGLFNGYLGLQRLGMAKDEMKEIKRQFNLNYDAQKRTTNAALEDRQRARIASNPGAYQSVGDYMNQNGIR